MNFIRFAHSRNYQNKIDECGTNSAHLQKKNLNNVYEKNCEYIFHLFQMEKQYRSDIETVAFLGIM